MWIRTHDYIITRITNKSSHSYEDYKNIKVDITTSDLKNLWFRDKAYLMKQPSIDRIDNNKGYTLENCRYIELWDNVRRNSTGGRPKKRRGEK